MTAILCALEAELKPYIKALRETKVYNQSMLTLREGYIGNTHVILTYCGVCKVNAAVASQVLISHFNISRMIMSGTAGGIDRRLKIGDTVVSTETAYHDVKADVLTEQPPYMTEAFFKADTELADKCRQALVMNPPGHPIYFGRIVTGESFIETNGRAQIIARFQPLCVDMETAAAAHACYVNKVPFLAVRSISDTEEDVGYGSFFQNCVMASEHSFTVVKALLDVL